MRSDAPQELREKFLAIITELNASEGDDGCYYGVAGNAAFLMQLQSIDPPSLLIKLRMKSPLSGHSDWAEVISQRYSDSLIECEIRDDYISVLIFLSDSLEASDVIEIFHSCITRHAKLLPSVPNYCYKCSVTGNGTVVQHETFVTYLCQQCQAAQSANEPKPDMEIHETREVFAALIPAAMILSAIGWAAFWLCYHGIFSGYRNTISIGPAFLVMILIFIVGFCLGLPVGKMLLKSGFSTYVSDFWMPFVVTIFTVILGECMMIGWELYRHFGEVNLSLIAQNFSVMFFGGSMLYFLYKLAFCIALGTSIRRVSHSPHPDRNGLRAR